MSYKQVEKISATIFKFSDIFVLKHVVRLSKKNLSNKRQYMHNEYSYKSNKYGKTDYLTSINLDFHPYLLIEQVNVDWTDREYISLNYIGLNRLKQGLQEVVNWFTDKKYKDLFYYENKQLKLNVEMNVKALIRITEKTMIMFRPTVVLIGDVKYEGVLMYVNKDTSVGRLTLDNLFAFNEIIQNFDLYNSSLSFISYLGRPEFGEFRTMMGDDNIHQKEEYNNLSTLGKNNDPIKDKFSNYFKT